MNYQIDQSGKILQATKKTDGRLRGCLSTLVSAQPRPVKTYYHQIPKKSRKRQ